MIGRITLGIIFMCARIEKKAFHKGFARIVNKYHIFPEKLATGLEKR